MGMDIFWNNTMENVCFPVFLILKNLFLLMDFQLGIIFVTIVLLDTIYCKALLVSNIWLLVYNFAWNKTTLISFSIVVWYWFAFKDIIYSN